MANLFSALNSASNAMDVFEKAMGVIQNNVTNASTPGYVSQSLNVDSRPFSPTENLWGGVQAGDLQSARSQYAEQSVWSANQQAGASAQQASSLNSLQSLFDVTGNTGIPSALVSLYAAFASWSSNPSDSVSRTQVISAAQSVAQAFNQSASGVQDLSSQADRQIQSTVSQINQLSATIADINGQIRRGGNASGGLDTQVYNTLEKLSGLTSIDVHQESDGTYTVLMGGQVPLVIGQTQTQVQVTHTPMSSPLNPGAAADAQIMTSTGQDVTAISNKGQLGALLQFRNTAVPSIVGDGQQQGSLNQLAQAIADRVNTILTNGQVSSGPPPVPGVPLFSYSSGSPTSVAGTLSLDASVTLAQLAAISATSANGTADALAQLANPQSGADMLNGMSYTDFYSSIASAVGAQASAASSAHQTDATALAQAQNMRAQISGVSLNEQATKLLEFQNAYQACAQMITAINSTTQDLMQMMQQVQAAS